MTGLCARALGLAPLVVRVFGHLTRPALAVVALRLGVEAVGAWPVAVAAAAVLLAWGLTRWAALERCLDGHPVTSRERDVQVDDHVAFARALAAVSARYLAQCEDQADTRRRARTERRP
jgi:hypothetical protein